MQAHLYVDNFQKICNTILQDQKTTTKKYYRIHGGLAPLGPALFKSELYLDFCIHYRVLTTKSFVSVCHHTLGLPYPFCPPPIVTISEGVAQGVIVTSFPSTKI